MKRSKPLVFFWRKIGRLKIMFRGNQFATLRFTPSAYAVREGLATVEGCHQGRGKSKGNT